jgi:hypothetical protein
MAMRFISTRLHGILDYAVGILLILSPFLFGFAIGGAAQWIPVVLGVTVIIYSLLTAYELGLSPKIPMAMHLRLDMIGGVLLTLSPWLFGFAHMVFWPHLVMGLFDIVTPLMTEREPSRPPARADV